MRPVPGDAYQTVGGRIILLTKKGKFDRWSHKIRVFPSCHGHEYYESYNEDGTKKERKFSDWDLARRIDADRLYPGDAVVFTRRHDVASPGDLGIYAGYVGSYYKPSSVVDPYCASFDVTDPILVMLPSARFSAQLGANYHDIDAKWVNSVFFDEAHAGASCNWREHCSFVPPESIGYFARTGSHGSEADATPPCRHEYVNVGFNSIRMACKHCGMDRQGVE